LNSSAPLRGSAAACGIGITLLLAATACGNEGGSTVQNRSPDVEVYQSEHHEFTVTTVVDGLDHPWGMVFLPNGDLLVTERPGRLRVVSNGELDPTPISGTPEVGDGGQGGLLDIALHPDFATNSLVYLSYAKPGADGRTTAVARGRLEGGRLEGVEEIFEADAWGNEPVHFGSRLAFDAAGFLFVSVGERGEMDQAQNLANDQGAILRLRDDGSIPTDNPFAGLEDHRPEIWAYGIRNAQGLAIHPQSGELWESEHGPMGGDEINVIRAGRNYGWPEITYGLNYDGSVISELTAMDGMEQPLHYWGESPAVAGLTIYDGEAFPSWQGNVFVAALAGEQLIRIAFAGYQVSESEVLLTELGHRLRDVTVGPGGSLYLLVDADDAPMLRIDPVGR
jgi:glucose/arabinose dehydrogenase